MCVPGQDTYSALHVCTRTCMFSQDLELMQTAHPPKENTKRVKEITPQKGRLQNDSLIIGIDKARRVENKQQLIQKKLACKIATSNIT